MKKNYLKIRLLAAGLLFGLFVNDVSAQLSGNYTINSANATAGTNYQSFTDFANDINTNGVNGPVVVDVAPGSGPYNEQVTLDQISGMSTVNRVTINGNGNLLTFNGNSGAPHVFRLNGTDNLTVNDLQMEGTNSSYAMVCILYNNANYNTFSGCSFSCTPNSTSSYAIPFAISGSGSSPSSGGNANNNTVTSCTLFSGYYAVFHYGLTSAPYTHDNTFEDCYITDWYYYGIYGYYSKNLTFRGCTFDRMTRTSLSSMYFMYGFYSQGFMFEDNLVKDLYFTNQTYSGTMYGFAYVGYYTPEPSNRNTFRNNIFRDIVKNGSTYMFYYNYNSTNDYYNNTFSWDYTNSTTGSTYLFYYCYGLGNNFNTWYNNNFSFTNPGSGTEYAMYFGSNTTGSVVDYNNYYMTSPNSYVGYWTSAATTLAQWQSQGPDPNGHDLDPMYANLATGDLHPTNTNLNNLGLAMGLLFDHEGKVRNQTNPDIGALEFLSPTCTGTPTQTVVGPNYEICPGEVATFSIGGLSPDLGLTYQWQMSNLSAVGPFTLQGGAGATNVNYTSPPNNGTMWYSAIISCTAPGGNSVQAVAQVTVAGTTTNTVPYYENFENIGLPNRLPNCSWSAPNIGMNAMTYIGAGSNNLLPRSGSSFAAFTNPGGMDYFYTNGIYMEPGVTYSASVWYQTDLTGANNWTDLSIMLGTSQSPTGLTTIATTGGPAVAIIYKSLSNTFTVPSAGMYYVAVRATGSSGTAMNLSWDDLAIEIPCQLNTPTVSMSANKTTICAGESVILTATGADNYSWDNGAGTGSMVTVTPLYNTYYTVSGTHAKSGCSAQSSQMIQVNPAPVVGVLSFPATACEGTPLNLQAYGASSYNWSTNKTGSSIMVTPTGPTSYTVQGTNSFGCMTSYVHQVTPFAKPVITAVGPTGTICKGDEAPASASGANSYIWKSNNVIVVGNPASLYPNSTTTYTVEGTDENGCTGETTIIVQVQDCTGLNEIGQTSSVKVYPNPTSGAFTVEMNMSGSSLVQVTDVTGRVIFSQEVDTNSFDVNISAFAAGIYYVQVSNGDSVERIKVIRN